MRALHLAALLLLAASASAAAPEPIAIDGAAFVPAAVEANDVALRNVYLREGETPERWSRQVRISDLKQAAGAAALARTAASLARMRAPAMGADSFSPEGREQSDITVAWLQVNDANDAVDYHVVRYVDADSGVREYALVVRRYLNNRPLNAVLDDFGPFCVANLPTWVETLATLDRAPQAEIK
jgi:hypothetical protein